MAELAQIELQCPTQFLLSNVPSSYRPDQTELRIKAMINTQLVVASQPGYSRMSLASY